jgi:hypothetical protein
MHCLQPKRKRIHHLQNFQDDFLLVINIFGPFSLLQKFISTIHDDDLLHAVVSQAQLDSSCENLKIDFGYTSGQNLVHATFGTTIPRILEKTHKPMYLEVQKDLSVLYNLTYHNTTGWTISTQGFVDYYILMESFLLGVWQSAAQTSSYMSTKILTMSLDPSCLQLASYCVSSSR